MFELRDHPVHCPYCGEQITVVIDCSIPEQSYIEDCEICCRPINFTVLIDPMTGEPSVTAGSDDDPLT